MDLFFPESKQAKKQFWTFEKCKEEALKYDEKIIFYKQSSSAYEKAYKKKWLDLITQHMKKRTYWTYETISKEATKYKTRSEFRIHNNKAYKAAYRRNLLNTFYSK